LAGEDAFFRMAAMRLLRAGILGDADPALSLLEYDEAPEWAEVVNHLRGRGLFTLRHMVVVDPADRLVAQHAEPLARYARSPSSSACLVLTVARWTAKGPLRDIPNDVLCVVACAPLRRNDVAGWLHARAQAHGRRLERGVAQLMIETAGTDLAVLDRHLQNLTAFLGDRANVSAEDVTQLVGGDPQRATWELVSAVVEAAPTRALTILRQIFRHGAIPLWLISALAAELSRLWRIKRMLRDGRSDAEMLEAVGRQFASRLRHLKRRADAMSPKRLLQAHQAVLEADIGLKTSVMPDELLLECLVLRLCGGRSQ